MTHINFTAWGEPQGIPEGSDFRLEAVLTRNGAKDSAVLSTGATYTLQISDSVLNAGVALLTDEAADSVSIINTGTLVVWEITDTQSSGWAAGTYNGDIKVVDPTGAIYYGPVTIKVRAAID